MMSPVRSALEREDAGFTLLELMVSLAALGLLSLLLLSGLQFGARVWERSRVASMDQNHVRLVHEEIGIQLARIYPGANTGSNGSAPIAFDGRQKSLSYLTARAVGEGGMLRVTLRMDDVEPQELVSLSGPELGIRKARRDVLLTDVVKLDFAYFGRSESGTLQWNNSWENKNRLPQLVRMRVTLRDKKLVWQDLVVAPQIQVGVSCAFDPAIRTCQGRT